MEAWKDIPGYEGLYMVSNFGNIMSNHKRNGRNFNRFSIILNGNTSSNGYKFVFLYKNKIRKTAYVHILVAKHFIGERPFGKVINHKDGIKINNFVSNLEYCTPKQNIQHAVINGLQNNNGINSPNSKLTEKEVISIRREFKRHTTTMKFLAKKYSISKASIEGIIYRKSWKHI